MTLIDLSQVIEIVRRHTRTIQEEKAIIAALWELPKVEREEEADDA